MPLQVELLSGDRVNFDKPKYDDEKKCFTLKSSEPSAADATIPYPLPLTGEFDPSRFFYRLFKRHGNSESDIFQVYDGASEKRVGWLIPVIAIESAAHEMASNRFFCNYAFAAYHELLSGCVTPVNTANFRPDGNYRISDFYDEDAVILIVSHQAISGLSDFQVEDYYACLLRNGYSISTRCGDAPFASLTAKINGNTRVIVQQIAPPLRRHAYIRDLLVKPLLGNAQPLVAFFLLYQVFELLMERIFETQRLEIVTEYLMAAEPNLSLVRGLFEKLEETRSDRQRMAVLFTKHFPGGLNLNDIRDVCNEFLVKIGGKEGDQIHTFLYPIRNKIVHELRSISPDAMATIPRINDALKDLVSQILIGYNAN